MGRLRHAYRREAWHDYLIPASPDYAGWVVPYHGRAWRLCPNDDPRYRLHACEACRDPRIVMETADVEALNAGKARKGRRPQFV